MQPLKYNIFLPHQHLNLDSNLPNIGLQTLNMSLSSHFVSSNTLHQLQILQPYPPSFINITTRPNKTLRTQCTFNNANTTSNADLASDLATEVAKLNTQLVQKEEAMNKSRELLFNELCQFMGLEKAEVKRKWSKLGEDGKWVLVKEFVNEWGVNFHPLSARSVKELIEEYFINK